MSSTETGVIFGNIVYEGTAHAERSVVVLNDIHIDIMDYISPASCADVQVRSGAADIRLLCFVCAVCGLCWCFGEAVKEALR